MIGKKLQQLRKKKNLTQEDLSEKLGISRSSLSLYEIDKREPDGETLVRIADYFDVSLDHLFGRALLTKDENNITQSYLENINTLSENEHELLELFRSVKNDKDQYKLLGRFEEIISQMTGDFKSNDAQSTLSKKNVG